MEVKSAFLYGKIEEEVYVCQPSGFEDPHFPDKVYKVEKALYRLHQAPRAWYETLSTYLLDNGFHRGQIDKTLFIKRHKDDILLGQVYVDDIIFGSTKKEMSTEFEKLMHDKFQMSSMGELSFFLRLHRDKVYKVEKALYGLHQAPRAWYETLSTYLLDNGFHRGQIDKTLFIKRHKDDILLVQVYVDDIIVGLTKKEMSTEFEKLMHDKFQMSSMGELSFFLGLQVQQKNDGIFISQDKYVAEILKKFDFTSVKTASTPMETNKALTKDEEAEDMDVHLYRSMIRSLMYLTTSRPDIMFTVCVYASHYVGASLNMKSTTGGSQFLGKRLISWQCKKQTIVANSTTEAKYVAATNCCGQETTSSSTSENEEIEITATIDGRVKTITEASIRRHLKLEDPDGIPTLPNAEIFEQLALIGPKKTSWEQFSSNIATAIICLATNRTFNFSKMIFEGEPATMPQSLGSDKGNLTLNELTVLCTTLVKKLEHKVKASKSRERTQIVVSDDEEVSEDPSKQRRILTKIDQNPSISMVKDEGTSWIQEDAETQGRTSADTKILLEQEEPTKLVEDPSSGEKGEKEISTAEVPVSTASAIPMINEEEIQRISRDAEIAKQLQAEIDIARSFSKAEVRKNMCMYLKNQGGYKQSNFRGMSYEDIRPVFKRVWDQNQSFVPKDYEIEKEVMKRSGFDFQKPPAKRQKIGEISESVEEQSAGKEKEVS
ncbi:putative ribonuclease H-like domain-containing protein [Tanacetum coccineum]